MDNDHLPTLERGRCRDAVRKDLVWLVRVGLNNKTTRTKRLGGSHARGQIAAELTRQFTFCFAEAHQDRLTTVIDLPACVIERVERCLPEDMQVTLPINTGKNMLEQR